MMELQKIYKGLKEKKFVTKQIQICINCGSANISRNQYTLHCNDCGTLNFYEVAWWDELVKEFVLIIYVQRFQMGKNIFLDVRDARIVSCFCQLMKQDVLVVALFLEQSQEINSKVQLVFWKLACKCVIFHLWKSFWDHASLKMLPFDPRFLASLFLFLLDCTLL